VLFFCLSDKGTKGKRDKGLKSLVSQKLKKKFNNKNLRMNQEIGFSSGLHTGQTDTVELSESSFASIKRADLEFISLWNEKVNFRETIYHLEIFL